MRHIKYVTDNPYRLLQVSSCTGPKELRKAADKATRTVQAGMPFETGLEAVFRSDELAHCAEIIKPLASDHKTRTIYRLFWPLFYERPLNADGTISDLEKLIETYEQPDIFQVTQLRFLVDWFSFLVHPNAGDAASALWNFALLCENIACDTYLIELLEGDGLPNNVAADCLDNVINATATHLLSTVCRQALDFWEAGDVSMAADLLAVVCGASFDEDEISEVLRPAVQCGDREMARLRAAIAEYAGWTPEQEPYNIAEVEKLTCLSKSLAGVVAVAGLWAETVDRQIAQVADAMRNYAIDLANEKQDWQGCRQILGQVQNLPIAAELQMKLRHDFETLRENEEAAARELRADQLAAEHKRLYEAILPIEQAPSLYTLNGIGTKLYGRVPFDTARNAYLATLYFVVIYIPLFPIARYLVRDAPGGAWYFDGKAAWSKGNKAHLSVFVLFCICFAGYLHFTGTKSESYDSVYNPPVPSALPAPNGVAAQGTAPASGLMTNNAAAATDTASTAADKTLPAFTQAPIPAVSRVDAAAERLARLRGEEQELTKRIKAENVKSDAENAAIEQNRNSLRDASQLLDELRKRLRDTQADIDAERLTVDNTDKDALIAFNLKVEQYNSDQSAYNLQVDQHETSRLDFNDRVAAYNAHVQRVNKDVSRLKDIVQALKELGD